MSVGGTVVQIYKGQEKDWINTVDDNEYCAVFVEPGSPIALGDTLWWQGEIAHWTPKGAKPTTIKRIGASGVNHPLGKEFEMVADFYPAFNRVNKKYKLCRKMIEAFLAAEPTDKDGHFCPVNQPQHFDAQLLLAGFDLSKSHTHLTSKPEAGE